MEIVTVPPYSEMELMAYVDVSQHCTWLIEGTYSPVLVAKVTCIVVSDQCKMVTRVVNTELTSVKLYKSMKIAKCWTYGLPHNLQSLWWEKSTTEAGRNTRNYWGKSPTWWYNPRSKGENPCSDGTLYNYSDILADGPDKIGHTGVFQHHIDTRNATLTHQQPGGSLFPSEKLYTIYGRRCCLKILYHHQRALGHHLLYCIYHKEGWINNILSWL